MLVSTPLPASNSIKRLSSLLLLLMIINNHAIQLSDIIFKFSVVLRANNLQQLARLLCIKLLFIILHYYLEQPSLFEIIIWKQFISQTRYWNLYLHSFLF